MTCKGSVVVIAMAIAMPGLGHHALNAEYDTSRSITLTGTVTKVEWSNPHVLLYLDTGEAGRNDVMHWELEMASPNLLLLNGLTIDTLRRGDWVTVDAMPARDGSNHGYARKVVHNLR